MDDGSIDPATWHDPNVSCCVQMFVGALANLGGGGAIKREKPRSDPPAY